MNVCQLTTRIAGDLLLYEAAKTSFGLAIDAFGRDEFQRKVFMFKQLQHEVEEKCTGPEFGHCDEFGNYKKRPERDFQSCLVDIMVQRGILNV